MVRMLTLASLLLLTGCGVTFDVPVESSATIKGGGLFSAFLPSAFADFTSLDLSQSQSFKNAGVGKNDVDSVKLKEAVLEIESPAGATLEFLDALTFYVEADGVPKTKIASKADIPDNATRITLDVEDVELAPYVTAPSMTVTTDTTAHAPKKDTTIRAKLVFTVDPKIF